ncbi:MAG TPA: VanZ family protein, partial [Gemmatimonadales bacterium]|nr:VanZ family protein [Gemmatimonadales bacterium]
PRLGNPAIVFGLGFVLSGMIETGQIFLPGRFPSPIDVTTNSFGAFLGAALLEAIEPRIQLTPGVVDRLALELPMMGLLYLLVPLLWVSSFAGRSQPGRWSLTVFIGLIGAAVVSALYRHRFGPAGAISALGTALVAALGFLVGALPGFVVNPILLGLSTTAVAFATFLFALIPGPDTGVDRRFEGALLKRIIPAFLVYLLLLAVWPPVLHSWRWPPAWGLVPELEHVSTEEVMSLLEYIAGFTLLGYALAEQRGRREEPMRLLMPRTALRGAACAAVLELASAFHEGSRASGLRLLMSVVAVGYGSALYAAQRAHIRTVLKRS